MTRLIVAFLVLAVASVAPYAQANSGADGDRPKIGLALAGGGAKGGAHVGVLRVLEKNRIPVDYIAGTSIGAIVGGLYAMGMTPEEIEHVIRTVDWVSIFEDHIDRKDRSFRRKRDDDLFLVKSKPGFRDGEIKLPTGLIQGQKIDLLLARLTLPVATIDDFDELGIPFRAVATDITTGDAVLLGEGSLARAIRASMSIPAILSPVRIGGRMLVDGGVANNLPIDAVRQMGADIIIAVDIGAPLKTEEELDSVIAITQQLTGILTNRGTQAQIATLTGRDRLIRVPVGDLSTADFERMQDGIGLGVAAAEEHVDWLRKLALSEEDYARHTSARVTPSFEPPVIDFYTLNNNSRIGDDVIVARAPEDLVGAQLDVDALEGDINTIYGMELFQNVRWTVVEENEQKGVAFDIEERAWGPNYLQFGLVLSDDLEGDSAFALTGAYTKTGVNKFGAELRILAALGDTVGISSGFYQPLDRRGRWFILPQVGYVERNIDVFEKGERIKEFRVTEYGGTLAGGREFGTWGELRTGLRRLTGEADVQIGAPEPDIDVDSGEAFVRFTVDELDNANFPTAGAFWRAEYLFGREDLGGDVDFDQLLLDGFAAKTWGRTTLLGSAAYLSTVEDDAPIQSRFSAGGLFNLSGFQANELSGQHLVKLAVIGFRKIVDSDILPVYAGASLEFGNVFEDSGDIKLDNGLWAGSVWLGSDTLIGPVYLAYGRAEGGNDAFYLLLGRTFGRFGRGIFRR
jgi:NTE family protein